MPLNFAENDLAFAAKKLGDVSPRASREVSKEPVDSCLGSRRVEPVRSVHREEDTDALGDVLPRDERVSDKGVVLKPHRVPGTLSI